LAIHNDEASIFILNKVILKLGHTRDQPGEKQVYTRKPKNRSMYFVQEDHCTCNGK
jgi:hypothetical protein